MKAPHLAFALVFTVLLGGCGITGGVNAPSCRQQCSEAPDPEACMAHCGACSGTCVSRPPEGFVGPTLLWYGPTVDVPPCPPSAPTIVYEGYTDPDDFMECDPCACSEPKCVDPDAPTAPPANDETAPAQRDGKNVTSDACDEGGTCQQDEPGSRLHPSAKISRCEPFAIPPPVPRLLFSPWARYGKACGGVVREDTCGDDASLTCTPAESTGAYAHCIMHLGTEEVNCPADYPEKLVLYGRRQDARTCTPCTCGPPTRDVCSWAPARALNPRHDDARPPNNTPSSNTAPRPDTFPPPQTPSQVPRPDGGSVLPADDHGRCEPGGGELVGEIKLLDPSTFCCQTRPGKKEEK